jgi:LPS-assembly lipoprotein
MTLQDNANTPRRGRGLRIALALPLLLALGACGFHLRGSHDVPYFLQEIALKMPMGAGDLGTELRLALERKGIATSGGDLQLEVTNEKLTRQTSSVDSSARAAEYILIYNVEFRINSSDGRLVGPQQSLILRRSYQYSAANVVGKSTEEETLRNELRSDAAQQIVRQLIALNASPLGPTDTDAAAK